MNAIEFLKFKKIAKSQNLILTLDPVNVMYWKNMDDILNEYYIQRCNDIDTETVKPEIKKIRYYINDEIVKKEMTEQSKECSHEIIISNVLIIDTKYRYCKHCGMLAHEDKSFSYMCGMEWCMCMQ